MEVIDIIVLIVIGIFAIKGVFAGFINEVFGILGILLGYVLSFQFYSVFGGFFQGIVSNKKTAEVLGFVAAFLVIYIIVIVLGKLLSKFFKAINLGWANKSGGFLFGAVKSAVIVSIALSFLIPFIPKDSDFSKSLKRAPVTGKIIEATPYVFDMLNKLSKYSKDNPFRTNNLLDKIIKK